MRTPTVPPRTGDDAAPAPAPAPAADAAPTIDADARPHGTAPLPVAELAAELGLEVHGDVGGVLASGVTASSRDVRAGDLFAALPGATVHGARFVTDARDAGAVAVLTDEAGVPAALGAGLPALVAAEPRAVLGAAAGRIHGTALNRPALYGVTGTNGKTTTVRLLEHLLGLIGETTGSSTTIGRRIRGTEVPGGLTTPEAPELHALLARMREQGVTAAAIEVSAHAMRRHRIDGLRFDVVGFTNLSHDHLDEFPDMEAYFAAKAALFTPEHARLGVVSLDSPWGRRVADAARIPVVTVSSGPAGRTGDGDWRVEVQGPDGEGTAFALHGPDGERLETSVSLLGAHMAADAGLAIAMLVAGGAAFSRVADAVRAGVHLRVPGRIHRVEAPRGPAVYVDISHTPDAFAKTLQALRTRTAGRLVMVFGADGDRDPSKRPLMGRVASELADVVYVTDHHSRFEDPDRIRASVLEGALTAPHAAEVHDVPEPEEAIRQAVSCLDEDDTVLWAGTGLTRYREIRGEYVPYSFHDAALAALQELHPA